MSIKWKERKMRDAENVILLFAGCLLPCSLSTLTLFSNMKCDRTNSLLYLHFSISCIFVTNRSRSLFASLDILFILAYARLYTHHTLLNTLTHTHTHSQACIFSTSIWIWELEIFLDSFRFMGYLIACY